MSKADLADEPYDSAEDEDFEFDATHDESDVSSSSDSEPDATAAATTATATDSSLEPARKKRKHNGELYSEAFEMDSGDEAAIRGAKALTHKQKRSRAGEAGSDFETDEDDEGGLGGFVKTRAMRMQM